MKKTILLFTALLLLTLISCRKEPKTVYVSYKILQTGNVGASYTVGYTLANKSTKTLGPITQSKWLSEKIENVDKGTYLTLSVEGNGGGSYDMFIYANGVLLDRRQADDGHGIQRLETQVPY